MATNLNITSVNPFADTQHHFFRTATHLVSAIPKSTDQKTICSTALFAAASMTLCRNDVLEEAAERARRGLRQRGIGVWPGEESRRRPASVILTAIKPIASATAVINQK